MAALVFTLLLLLLGMTGYSSSGSYCICKGGLGDTYFQKNIDYACGHGADCSAILQKGGCYQPNTVKAHCDYAVNYFYQKKGQSNGTCDFGGTAFPSPNLPTTVASGCSYPASPSQLSSSTATGSSTTGSSATAAGSTSYNLGPSGSIGPSGGSTPSHQASSLIVAVMSLFSLLLVLW